MEKLTAALWGGFTIALVLICGLYHTIRSGIIQLRLPKLLWDKAAGSPRKNRLGAVTAALAASMGTGNITGCGAAIAAGGPGAVFWMWISAFMGMALGFAENRLGAEYALKYPGISGSPMLYMEKGLGSKTMARLYACCCLAAAFAMGCMSQSWAFGDAFAAWISDPMHNILPGISHMLPPVSRGTALRLMGGLLIAALTAAVIFSPGTVSERVMSVTEKAVPIMGALYAAGCIVLITSSDSSTGEAFGSIITCAFTPKAALGGAAGITVKKAVSVGLRRGVFSNEAGLGSSVLVHSDADFGSPEQTGAWAAFEVFLDTIVCCTLTALALLTSPLYRDHGICSVTDIFTADLGRWGGAFICLCICAFAWAAVIGWCVYGEKCFKYLFPNSSGYLYRLLFCMAAIVGAAITPELIFDISDIFNWLAMMPNLIAVTILSRKLRKR